MNDTRFRGKKFKILKIVHNPSRDCHKYLL